MSINFSRTNWVNNSAPAITAAQLNRMEKGIADCAEAYNSIPTVYKFKGTLEYFSDLPTDNNEIGDVYNILDDGYNYAWNGITWQILNISIDLTPISQGYIIEQGTKEVDGVTWTYEKWNSSIAKCMGMVATKYFSAKVLENVVNLPINLLSVTAVFVSLEAAGNQSSEYDRSAKYKINSNGTVSVFVYDVNGDFTTDSTATVSVCVIGGWK